MTPFTTQTSPSLSPAPTAADVLAACERVRALAAEYRRTAVDVFLVLEAEMPALEAMAPPARPPSGPFAAGNLLPDRLAGLPVEAVATVEAGRLRATELNLAGKRVGAVGRLAEAMRPAPEADEPLIVEAR